MDAQDGGDARGLALSRGRGGYWGFARGLALPAGGRKVGGRGMRQALALAAEEGAEELAVGGGLAEAVEDALGGVAAVVGVGEEADHAAEEDDLLVGLFGVEELLAASAGADDVDGGEVASLGELAVEVELHVAGALELFVDDLVHAGAGVDEAGGDDGERTALLDVASAAEELLGRVEGDGVDAAGEGAAAGGYGEVVGAGEAGDGARRMTTSLPSSTRRLARSRQSSATRHCSSTFSSKVEAKTSPSTERRMSVTSSGRSPMRATMRMASGQW